MAATEAFLRDLYLAFNTRNLDAALAALHPEVEWADGEGKFVHGRSEVRKHWMEQWQTADPYLEPLHFTLAPDGREIVDVRMVVRSLAGEIQSDRQLQNVFTIAEDLIRRMEIR
jgi:hypothetical protein